MKAFQKLTFIVCLPAAMLLLSAQASHADSATWNLNPGSGDWNTATNWTPVTVPNGSADTATFDLSNTTGVSLSTFTEVNGIVFNAGASAFTITASPTFTLTISGVGITNNSGLTQNFVTAVDGAGNLGAISFTNSATAGSLTAFTNNGSTFNDANGGELLFSGTSTAGGGTFTTNGGAVSGAFGGVVFFEGTSTAGNGTFTTNGGAVSDGQPGVIEFIDSSTAGNGTLINNSNDISSGPLGGTVFFLGTSTAGNGTFTNNGGTVSSFGGGPIIQFQDTSTAGNGTFINNGGTVSGASSGTIVFFSATAGSGTFINNGGAVSNAGGSYMQFSGTSTAGNGILIANGGLGGGGGGLIRFLDDSTGGTARAEVFGNGSLDLTDHNAPGVTVGSIEGSGAVILAANNLTVGSNNLSTNFSGSISGGGSLAKIGAGTLTLSGANFYSAGTSINAGTLEASQDGALGFGDVSVTAPGATLTLQTGATNNYIADTATLSIVSGSTVDLNFNGSADRISGLLVDGVAQPTGLYGSLGSGAPHELPVFAGTGRIQVGVLLPPVITSPVTATGVVGQPFSYQITATNNPTSFDATGLPENLTVDTSTGLISGTPAAAGIFSITLSATNADGTGTAPLTLTVNPPPPVITSPSTATGVVGQAFSYQITATNTPTSFNATGLPANLTVNTSTGLISGTAATAGTFPTTLSATNAGGTGTAPLTLTVNPPPPVITSPATATATVGQAFSYQITATNSPTSFNATGLPAGLTVDTGTGAISGTPSVAGSFSVNLSATNAGGTGSEILSLDVAMALPVITSPLSAMATTGQPFTYQITATNSATSFDASGLPLGLAVDSGTGVISGTPFEDGNFMVTLSATNASGTGTQILSLDVTLPVGLPVPIITSPDSATATVGQFYVYQIVATELPTSYDALNLPPGLTVDPTLGFISGIPTEAGTTQVTLIATNESGSGTSVLALTVQAAPVSGISIISSSSATGRTNDPFLFHVVSSGTSSAAQLSASGLPPGLDVDPVTGDISGVPTKDGSFSVLITVTEAGMSASATLQLTFTSDPAVPVIVSSSNATLVPGQPFNYQILTDSSSDEPTTFSTVGDLPPGLGVNPATGLISGTPPPKFGLSPLPHVSGGVITNTQLVACNSSGCASKNLFFPGPTGAANISTRLSVGTDEDVSIAGFITRGDAPMKLVIRANGPALPGLPLGSLLSDPYLALNNSDQVVIGSNDNWKDDLAGGSQEAAIQTTGYAPGNTLESAILAVLMPGKYTAIMRGAHNETGIGLVEVYNLGAAALEGSGTAQLGNISTRGKVQTDAGVMIGGFINQSAAPVKVVVRALGPELAPLGVNGVLPDPMLELHKADGTIIVNDSWMADPTQKAEIMATGYAPSDPLEPAIVFTLPAAAGDGYTAIVSGVNGATGVALVEVYFGDPCLGTSCP